MVRFKRSIGLVIPSSRKLPARIQYSKPRRNYRTECGTLKPAETYSTEELLALQPPVAFNNTC